MATLEDFGDLLRVRRRRRGLTLMALAERSGLSVSQVSRLERGERQPTEAVVRSLAVGLGLTGPTRDRLFVDAGFIPDSPWTVREIVELLEERGGTL